MAVPEISQLHAGVGVNIVLKVDQKTGKLTTGQIADLLTKGNHPRGIKVRLTNGLIGRVQSLSSTAEAGAATALRMSQAVTVQDPQPKHQGRGKPAFKFLDDYRNEPIPQDSISLEDYIKPTRKKGKKKAQAGGASAAPAAPAAEIEREPDTQEQLRTEFPSIDSALIAAILADHPTVQEAREVLGVLS